MLDRQDEITNLNELQLTVPEDGTPGLIEGQTWRLPWGMDANQETLRSILLYYEPVRSATGKLVDVVAWEPAHPDRWYHQTGQLPLLGAEELERVSWTTLPTYLVDTPARWRELDRRLISSICILDWSADLPLSMVWGTFILESQTLRDWAAGQVKIGRLPGVNLTVAPIP